MASTPSKDQKRLEREYKKFLKKREKQLAKDAKKNEDEAAASKTMERV